MAICCVKDTENTFKMQMNNLNCIPSARFVEFASNQSLPSKLFAKLVSKINNYQLNIRSNLWEAKEYKIRRTNYNAKLLL